jgi:hypothetical protein
MTSTTDTATWTGGDPKTGTWHEGCNEWGNLTLMGDAYVSASHYAGDPVGDNTKFFTGLNEKQMEGLTEASLSMYGGDNDDDDSGSISYLSLRYGGKVVGQANELNGLSLGGIGRETDIHHVEIMNNVDDGIEIWGGTVNLKYVAIWNVGDDSFDIDEGWRGKAQFVLIVQGYSINASQGSGVGDNCFETDGAEDCDAQPVTTATIYNATVIGQYDGGDGGTTWRDNARIQYRNCVFMDIGEELVRFDNADGDGALGYDGSGKYASTGGYTQDQVNAVWQDVPADGTLSFEDTWLTNAQAPYAQRGLANAYSDEAGTVALTDEELDAIYPVQVDGKLAEITNSVFWGRSTDSHEMADEVGVLAHASNVDLGTAANSGDMPIQTLDRAATSVTRGGKTMWPVETLNPCAANAALTVYQGNTAPADGFFTPAPFRGAFSKDNNWLKGWTAAAAYNMLAYPAAQDDPTPDADAAFAVITETTFETEEGVVYTVEKSGDMQNWIPVGTITGDATGAATINDTSREEGQVYRVIKQ